MLQSQQVRNVEGKGVKDLIPGLERPNGVAFSTVRHGPVPAVI